MSDYPKEAYIAFYEKHPDRNWSIREFDDVPFIAAEKNPQKYYHENEVNDLINENLDLKETLENLRSTIIKHDVK